MAYKPNLNIPDLYARFASPICEQDCGEICRQHNPSGKPFCCDICVAVPVALKEEWAYLKANTKLWHRLRGDECPSEPIDKEKMQSETPDYMRLVACRDHNCEALLPQLPSFPFTLHHATTANRHHLQLGFSGFAGSSAISTRSARPTAGILRYLRRALLSAKSTITIGSRYARTLHQDRHTSSCTGRRTYLLSPKTEKLTLVRPENLPVWPYR